MIDFDIYRIIFSFICGYFLAVSGSLTQLVSHNSLSSPSTLGMDGVGVFVVIISQFIMLNSNFNMSLEKVSLFGFLILFFIITLLLTKKSKGRFEIWKGFDMNKVILIGISFNLLVAGIFSLVQFLFMTMNLEFPTSLWFGQFKFYEKDLLVPFVLLFVGVIFWIRKYAQKVNILNLGTDYAYGLGLDVIKVQKVALLMSLFLTGIVITQFGVFSFLGLIFPHVVRSFRFFKTSMRRELLFGPMLCGFALMLIDLLCYNWLVYSAEIPVGMFSGILGTFLLIFLLIKTNSFTR